MGFGFPTPVKTVQELNPTVKSWARTQLYNRKTDQWTAIPGRNAYGGTVIALDDGSVLVAEGYADATFPSLGAVTDQAYGFTP